MIENMHVKSLKVFCDVVGRRSFSRAAHDNGMSQSRASQMVLQLEQQLGVTLLDRSKRPFVLTAEGDVFYRGCRKLVQGYAALEEEVRTLHDEVEGLVRVACIYSVGLSHMSRYVQDFLARNPRADVRVQYQHPDKVYELVETDAVDFGLVSYPKTSRSIKADAWREEPMVLACAPGHPLGYQPTINLEQLDGATMVGFDEGLRIRRELDRALAAHGAEVNVVMEFDNIETIKRAIEIDAGVGLLPEPTVTRETRAGTLVAVPVTVTSESKTDGASKPATAGTGQARLTRPLGIIQRRGKRLGATASRFVRALRNRAGRPQADKRDHDAVAVPDGATSSTEIETVP